MTTFLGILLLIVVAIGLGLLVALLDANKRANAALKRAEKTRRECEEEITRGRADAAARLAEAQNLLDGRAEQLAHEAAKVRQHYLDEARRIQSAAKAKIDKLREEMEPLRRFEALRRNEIDVEAKLAAALAQATALTTNATEVLRDARARAADEAATGADRVRDKHEQANARLDHAIREAGRILAEAEKRAVEIGGEAYAALSEKRSLEKAAEAMRNIVEGYGDRYLIPTQTILDTLAIQYGYDAAGQALAAAREQSRRMVEQGLAAECDYAEANRRAAAIRFVIHAFNGTVDSILTKVKTDNFGVLEQRIKDQFNTVNLEGSAFRNARVLPAYLDARIAELRSAVVVQALAERDREEQRYLKEQERDQRKAEEERLRRLREIEQEKTEVEKERALRNAVLAEAESRLALTQSEDERRKIEAEIAKLQQEVALVNLKLEEATRQELTIAQQTRRGRIYIISNVGSFGEGIYKIGLTRRNAEERIDELNSASVPFEFDILGVIETDDAPALEYKIHQHFLPARINKVNPRKEFFRIDFEEIRKHVAALRPGVDILGNVLWTERALAEQYRESLRIEGDATETERWLQRNRAQAERRRRDEVRRAATIGSLTDNPVSNPLPATEKNELMDQTSSAMFPA